MKMVDQLVVDDKIMKDLKMRSEKNRLDIIRSLGEACYNVLVNKTLMSFNAIQIIVSMTSKWLTLSQSIRP